MAKRNGGIIGPSNVPNPFIAKGVWKLRDAFNYIKAGLWPSPLGYQVNNSLRFNSGSSDDLSRTPASAGDRQKWTYSVWVKKSDISNSQSILAVNIDGSNRFSFRVGEPDDFHLFDLVGGSFAYQIKSSALYRDVSAWYHFVIAFDTTQATDTNRVKIYVNGSQVTAFATASYPSQNSNTPVNNNVLHRIGSDSSGDYFNGYLSEIYMIDGQQLTPSSFGQTDSATGIWTPTAYTGSFGTNGFYLKFANSAALGTDSSGNGNTFTANNLTSVDQSTDTPTNNFATLNPLDPAGTTIGTMTEGNLQGAATSNAADFIGRSTMAVNKGKWYWEAKCISSSGGYDNYTVGIDNVDSKITTGTQYIGYTSTSYAYYANGGTKINNNSFVAYGSSFTAGDIIGVALDLDNGFIYFSKNGTYQNSGVPTSGATGTGNAFSSLSGTFTPAISDTGSVTTCIIGMNFGSPPFTIASGNADGDGYGNFEYAVPSGYYAICTKNLATYG
jgi:hypothetical protein